MITRYLISTICIALLLWGCDNTTTVSAKPKVVRKKIVAPKDNTAKVRTKKTVRTAQKKPAAKQPTKTVVAKVDKTSADAKKQPTKTAVAKVDRAQANAKKQPTAKKNIDPQPLIAKKKETKPVQNNQPLQATQKKPAISPKSELTEIKKAVRREKQTQPVDNKAMAGEKLVASTGTTASKMLSGGIPAMYDPTGKIDPFEPLYKDKSIVAKKKRQIKRAPRTPLERIDLSQLRLVGIILAASGNRALVEESSGKGYVIKKGTYIGINGGKIVKINKEIVTVEEQFEDVFGKIQTRNRELKLPKPPGEF